MDLLGAHSMTKNSLVAVAVLLGACHSSPIRTDHASKGDYLGMKYSEPLPGTFALTIKRDRGVWTCDSKVYIDGQHLANVGTSEAVIFHLQAGRHVIGARAGGLCTWGDVEAEVEAKAGEARTYRLSFDNGITKLGPTAF
jgi:hypothetical protein